MQAVKPRCEKCASANVRTLVTGVVVCIRCGYRSPSPEPASANVG